MGLSLRVHEIATKEILFTTLLDGLLVHRSLPSAYLPIFSNTLVFFIRIYISFEVPSTMCSYIFFTSEWRVAPLFGQEHNTRMEETQVELSTIALCQSENVSH